MKGRAEGLKLRRVSMLGCRALIMYAIHDQSPGTR